MNIDLDFLTENTTLSQNSRMKEDLKQHFLMKHSLHRNIILFAHFHNVNLCGWI